MDLSTGQWILVITVTLALVFGAWRAATDGRFRGTRRVRSRDDRLDEGGAMTQAGQESDGVGGVGRDQSPDTSSAVAGTPYADQLGERATFLQFSSAFCAPCRATRRVLEEVTEIVPGVAHVEVDAESQLELVRRLQVMRTPTTLVLDAAGREVTRATGAPTKPQVLAALAQVE